MREREKKGNNNTKKRSLDSQDDDPSPIVRKRSKTSKSSKQLEPGVVAVQSEESYLQPRLINKDKTLVCYPVNSRTKSFLEKEYSRCILDTYKDYLDAPDLLVCFPALIEFNGDIVSVLFYVK